MSIEQVGRSKLLYVRASDRLPSSKSNVDFNIDLSSGSDLHNASRVVLRSIHFVNSQFNVRTGVNDQMSWSHNAIDYSGTVPEGQYTIITLMAATKAMMDAAMVGVGVTVTITQDALTDIISISWSASTGFVKVQPPPDVRSLADTLGFKTERAPSEPYLSDSHPELEGLTHCFIRSRVLAPQHQIDSQGDIDDTLCSIPVLAPYRGTNHYEPYDDEIVSINYQVPRNVENVDIRLTDEFKYNIGLQPYDQVELTFKVYF